MFKIKDRYQQFEKSDFVVVHQSGKIEVTFNLTPIEDFRNNRGGYLSIGLVPIFISALIISTSLSFYRESSEQARAALSIPLLGAFIVLMLGLRFIVSILLTRNLFIENRNIKITDYWFGFTKGLLIYEGPIQRMQLKLKYRRNRWLMQTNEIKKVMFKTGFRYKELIGDRSNGQMNEIINILKNNE